MDQCRTLDDGRAIERTRVQRPAATLAAIAAAAALIIAFGPAYLRHGLSALLVISRSAEASSPYSIEVMPGNTKVPRGADQTVKAKLVGFTAADVSVMMRAGRTARSIASRSSPAQAGAFEGMLSTSRNRPSTTSSPTVSARPSSRSRWSTCRRSLSSKSSTASPPIPASRRERPKAATSPRSAAPKSCLHVVPTMTTPDGRILLSEGAAHRSCARATARSSAASRFSSRASIASS